MKKNQGQFLLAKFSLRCCQSGIIVVSGDIYIWEEMMLNLCPFLHETFSHSTCSVSNSLYSFFCLSCTAGYSHLLILVFFLVILYSERFIWHCWCVRVCVVIKVVSGGGNGGGLDVCSCYVIVGSNSIQEMV